MTFEIKDIFELNTEFEKIKDGDFLTYLKFHEANIQSIENIEIEKDLGHFEAKLRLISEYGLSLVSNKQYSNAIVNLENSIKMFESYKNESELKTIKYFEGVLYNYGLALFYLNRNKEALNIFKKLSTYYPKNENCKSWIHHIKVNIAKKYTAPAWILCFLWLFGDLTIFKNFNSEVQFILMISGTFILLFGVGLELFIYSNKRNIK